MPKAKSKPRKPNVRAAAPNAITEQFNVAIGALPDVFKQAHDYADVHASNKPDEGKACHDAAKADAAKVEAALIDARDFCAGSSGPTLRTRLESLETKYAATFNAIQHVGARRSVWKLWHTIHRPGGF